MTEHEVHAAPVVRVAQDLTRLVDMSTHLLTQAVHSANDRELPGGDALVALAPVADPTAYAENIEAAEWRHATDPLRWPAADTSHEDDLETVLEVLIFWSEDLRTRHDMPLEGRRPTIASEANVIRWALNWMWDNEVKWDDFAADIRKATRSLENILRDGVRRELGVMCPTCETPRPRLVLRHNDADPTGKSDEYRCPVEWNHQWNIEDYRRWVGVVYLAHAEALTADDIANQHGIKPGTLRQWAARGQVAKRGKDHSGRQLYDVGQAVAARDGERVAG